MSNNEIMSKEPAIVARLKRVLAIEEKAVARILETSTKPSHEVQKAMILESKKILQQDEWDLFKKLSQRNSTIWKKAS